MKPRAWVCVVVMVLLAAGGPARGQQEVVRQRYDMDGTPLTVTTTRSGFRLLRVGQGSVLRGGTKPDKPGFLAMPYTRSMVAVLGFQEIMPTKVLVLGCGTGALGRFFATQFTEPQVEVVDDSEVMLKAAKDHFELEAGGRLKLHHEELRKYVSEAKKKYDVIFVDTYPDGELPHKMATREFYRALFEKLERGGHAVLHYWRREDPPTRNQVLATAQAVFGEVYMLEVGQTNSTILICARRKSQTTQEDAVERASEIMQASPLTFDLPVIIRRTYQYATKMPVDARVLTDKGQPVQVD